MAVSRFRVDANPASSTITRDSLVDAGDPVRAPVSGARLVSSWTSLSRVSVADPGEGVAEFLGGGGLRRQPDDGAAGVPPRRGEHPHHGGLPGPGRRQRQLHPPAAGGDLPDHRACAVFRIRPPLLADHSSIASSTSAVGDASPVGPAGGGDDPPLGVQHRG